MTLKEAISHIQRADGCDEVIALAQLRRALADGAIEVRWGSDKPMSALFDVRPQRRTRLTTFWQTVPIDEGGGFIPGVYPEDLPNADPDIEDNSPEQYLPRRYYLFVLRESISRYWVGLDPEKPFESQSPAAEGGAGVAAAPDIQESTIKDGRNASNSAIRQTLLQIYDEADAAGTRPPNSAEVFALVAKRLLPLRTSREKARPIIKEFEDRRWIPGQRSPTR